MGKALERYVTVRYDESHQIGGKVAKRFGVSAFPTLLVLDAEGNEVDEMIGGILADDLVKELARVERGEDTLLALRRRAAAAPDDVDVAVDLAERLAMRRPEEALRLATAAFERVEPTQRELRGRLHLLRAELLGFRERGDDALAELERVLEELPDTEAATHVVGALWNVAYFADPQRSLLLLERAAPIARDDLRDGLDDLRAFLYGEAMRKLLLKRVKAAWDDGEMLNQFAWECYERGWMTTEALEWAHRAVDLTDRAPHVLDTLACLLFRSNELDGAIRVQAEALLRLQDDAMRAELEEHMAMFYAVKRVRERARDAEGAR